MWYPIITDLKAHLITALGAGIAVGLGPAAGNPSYPSVRVVRDTEPEPRRLQNDAGESRIYLDCAVRSDEVDADDAYGQLAGIEDLVAAALKTWQPGLPQRIGIAAAVTIEEAMSDEGIWRPIYESRTVLKVKWKR